MANHEGEKPTGSPWWEKRPNVNQLKKILDDHKNWLDSGANGEPPHDLSGIDLSLRDREEDSRFIQDCLRNVDLRRAKLVYANFEGSGLSYANFQYADLSNASLKRSILIGATLDYTNLAGAKLERTKFQNACLNNADLSYVNGSVIASGNTKYNDFEGARMKGANLSYAKLLNSNFEGAKLDKAKINRAHLMESNMLGARLYNVNAIDANLGGAKGLIFRQLAGAYLAGAVLPGSVAFIEPIDVALRATRYARRLLMTALLIAIYVGWNSWNWNESTDGKIKLAILHIDTTYIQFGYISIALLFFLFLFYHFYLLNGLRIYAFLPAQFQNHMYLWRYPDPWAPLHYVKQYLQLDKKQNIIELLFVCIWLWFLLPLAVLIAAIGFTNGNDLGLSTYHFVLMVIFIGFSFLSLKRSRLSFIRESDEKVHWVYFSCITAVCIIAFLLTCLFPQWFYWY